MRFQFRLVEATGGRRGQIDESPEIDLFREEIAAILSESVFEHFAQQRAEVLPKCSIEFAMGDIVQIVGLKNNERVKSKTRPIEKGRT